ncbi:MAG: hypothetical protein NT001_01460, partial [Candidatus Woesearchaeota archaeon]|nr:hypothetical protein [Candidatus Woesearchaeota archaeon]
KDSAPSEYVGIYDAGIHDGSWKKAIDNIFTRNEGKIDDDIITRTLKFHGIYPNSADGQEMLPFYISANRQIKRKKIARTHFDIKGARNLIIRMFGMDRMTEILNKSESLGVFNGEKSTESLEDLVCAS